MNLHKEKNNVHKKKKFDFKCIILKVIILSAKKKISGKKG